MVIEILIIGFMVYQFAILIAIYLLITKYLNPYLQKKNELLEKEIKNKKFELISNIDIEEINKKIDTYFDNAVNRYIVYKFIANKVTYINGDKVETMINDITKSIAIDISEVYINYISILTSITDQEELIRYIHNRVRNSTVEAVSAFNKSEQILNL